MTSSIGKKQQRSRNWELKRDSQWPTDRDSAKPPSPNGEWDVIQSAISGDCEGLSRLFARERSRLYQTAFAILRNKQDSEDALQFGLLSAYLNLGSFEGRSKFSTWLTRVVRNEALMNRRKLRVIPATSLDEIVDGHAYRSAPQLVDPRPSPEQACALAEVSDRVRKHLAQLSPLLKLALHLRDLEGFSVQEAAAAAGIKTSAMKSRTIRARRQLASLLAARGVGTPRMQIEHVAIRERQRVIRLKGER
jgi:RNA polymerase sigma-70 factor, ECF subfamily